MLNPFKSLSDEDKTRDREKKIMHNQISSEAWEISKKVLSGKLRREDYDKIEKMYNEYFTKFPDEKAEKDANKRLQKLRAVI